MKQAQPDLFNGPATVRMTVPVSPYVRDAFVRLAAVQGCSVGKAMGDWLESTLAGVEAMTEVVEQAKGEPGRVLLRVNSYAQSIAGFTEDVIHMARTRPDGYPEPESAQPRQAAERSGAAGAAARSRGLKTASPPPYGNTGGKVPKAGKKAGGGSR